jgi:hypothetical protein
MLLARPGALSPSTADRMQRSVACNAGGSARLRLAVVGDIHDQWSAKDAAALKALDAVSMYADCWKQVTAYSSRS